MGLFSSKPGGTFFGNLFRAGLNIGATALNIVAPGSGNLIKGIDPQPAITDSLGNTVTTNSVTGLQSGITGVLSTIQNTSSASQNLNNLSKWMPVAIIVLIGFMIALFWRTGKR